MKQGEALEVLKMGKNVFLTGSAGSGKTYLLNQYIKYLKQNRVHVAVTASTGIAATHMNGVTIHSWSGLGVRDQVNEKEIEQLSQKSYLARRFQKTRVLLIDEVSMLHASFLDMVDQVCQRLKGCEEAFGGMQVILCGDFFQLPPVSREGEQVEFVDLSNVWSNMDLHVCYLDEQFRHEDDELMQILGDIRNQKTGEHTLVPLRTCYKAQIEEDIVPVKLCTHNSDADRINYYELGKIDAKEHVYDMDDHGIEGLIESLKRSCLAPERLVLKEGAAVMFVKNDFEVGYVNGTLGTVVGFEDDGLPIVEIAKGRRIVAEPVSWLIEENDNVKAEIEQVPLRLAWAITVHKSQGMTLDAAEVDLSKAFEKGMGYVALSRVRSLGGLRLMGLNKTALQIHDRVVELDKELVKMSADVVSAIECLDEKEIKQKQTAFILKKVARHKESTYEKTKILLDKKLTLDQIVQERAMTKTTIMGHVEKMLVKGERLNLDHWYQEMDSKRIKVIHLAFRKADTRSLSPVREMLGDDFSYEELRLARLFLK